MEVLRGDAVVGWVGVSCLLPVAGKRPLVLSQGYVFKDLSVTLEIVT